MLALKNDRRQTVHTIAIPYIADPILRVGLCRNDRLFLGESCSPEVMAADISLDKSLTVDVYFLLGLADDG